jgi:hypothetical protein
MSKQMTKDQARAVHTFPLVKRVARNWWSLVVPTESLLDLLHGECAVVRERGIERGTVTDERTNMKDLV